MSTFRERVHQRRQERRQRKHDEVRYGYGIEGGGRALGEMGLAGVHLGGEQYGQSRQALLDMQKQYAEMAAGGGPSLAREQLAAQASQDRTAAARLMYSAPGTNPAAAARLAMQQQAQMAGQTNMQAAQIRAQEQLGAMAGQAQLAGAQSQLDSQRQIAYEQMLRGQAVQSPGLAAGANAAAFNQAMQGAQMGMQTVATVGGAAGAVGGSDERMKKNIRPGNMNATQAVGQLNPYDFEYQSGYGQPGLTHHGIMAQELEKVAPQAVIDTPSGKMVHGAQLAALNTAALSESTGRLDRLEKAIGLAQASKASRGKR